MFRGNKVSRRNKKEGVMKNIISYKREIISVALISLLIFLSLSLISFSPQDNSFFYYSSSSDVVKNWCGFLGAQFAGLVFYLLGSASLLLIPLLAFFTAICLFKISFLRHLDRTLAAFLFFFSVCSIFQLHSVNIYGVEGGGYVGFWLTKYIVSSLGKGGGFVLFYTSLWVSGCFLFRVSFVNLFAFIFSHLAKGVIIAAKKLGVSVVVFARKIGIK